MAKANATKSTLKNAVHLILASSAAVATTLYAPGAVSQEQTLDEIVITGSRIRRVDEETASPVFKLERAAIEASGATTIGELVQKVPSISGAATNPQVNNGGGDGASNVELRGLGTQRTLVLLNGRRVLGGSAVDVNIFPVNLIERVDVLKEGAGAIYGTDAIGGVVNFITRTDFDGIEIGYDYGQSTESDGRRDAVSLAWGTNGERGSMVVAANWNKQEAISAGNREFSRNALYLYSGSAFEGGSSRNPNGRIYFPAGSALEQQFGCGSVRKVPGAASDSLANYECFVFSEHSYNYQPLNYIMTPQERGSVFTAANYDITGDIEAYGEWLYNFTTSSAQLAELPFDSRLDDVVIPANNYYNPFGIDFGGVSGVNPNAMWRLQSFGTRLQKYQTTSNQINLGVRGDIGSSSWTWDLSGNYAGQGQARKIDGYYLSDRLKAAIGPSFLDPVSGEVVCGTPGNIITPCTPINIFDVNNPDQLDAVNTVKSQYRQSQTYTVKGGALDFTGDLFELPAGKVQAAVGAGYTEFFYKFDTDTLSTALPPNFDVCGLSQETCSSDTVGGYDVSELYAEVFVPLLADAPLASALNLTLGIRYSDYSTFGDTTNSSVKLEWRPISDLLLRASWSEVFRAPTVTDLYGGALANAPTFNDPCVGLTQAAVDANPNLALACVNVPRDGSFEQPNSQVTGIVVGSPDLQPETGDVFTAGFVYQPGFLDGLSVTVDWWQYKLKDAILAYDNLGLDVNTTAEVCTTTGETFFCDLIRRAPDGGVLSIGQPSINLGKIETSGVDVGLKYRLDTARAGSFQFGVDVTYIDKFDATPCPVCEVQEIAGTFDRQYGNYAEWRGIFSVGWGWQDFSALLTARHIDSIVIKDPDGAPGIQPDLPVSSRSYVDLNLGYTFRENLKLNVGINNLTDEQPPIMYQNNVLNGNSDASTYDYVGSYYYAGVKYKF